MATRTSVYNSITGVCDVHSELDLEQILDIILSKGETTGNKFDDYGRITADWDVKNWQSVLKEFYSSYKKADLCKVSFEEINPNTQMEPMIEAQKEVTAYKKAPDNYYLHMICDELEKPMEGTPVDDNTEVLLSVYAAISSGENYGSVGNPPMSFIEQVVGLNISKEDYYATVMEQMRQPESFEKVVCDLAKENKELVKEMKTAYKRLVDKDLSAVVEGLQAQGGNVLEGLQEHGGNMLEKAGDMLSDGKVLLATAGSAAAVAATAKAASGARTGKVIGATEEKPTKSFGKWGIILLIINGIAVPLKWSVGFAHIGYINGTTGFMSAILPAISTIFSCFIPIFGIILTLCMMGTAKLPFKWLTGKIANVFWFLALLCSAYSGYHVITVGVAAFAAWGTGTFSMENIAVGAQGSLIDNVKAGFQGIMSKFGG